MNWLVLPRVPEPEAMDDSGEVEAYSSTTVQKYLSEIDDTFVDRAIELLGGTSFTGSSGRAIDIGTGPGQIIFKLAKRLPSWQLIGLDRSLNMLRQTRTEAMPGAESDPRRRAARAATAPAFVLGDATCLPFADASFDLVLCNSVLHHLAHPATLLAEIGRVAKPSGAILVRDLRRPSRIAFPIHVRWFGRHYTGLMHRLYCDSVRSAYTPNELAAMLRGAPLTGARIFTHRRTHLGLERASKQAIA